MLNPVNCSMQCIECMKVLPMGELLLLWPRRELKLEAWTSEPDFFCRPCAKELKIDHLPRHSQKRWLNQGAQA